MSRIFFSYHPVLCKALLAISCPRENYFGMNSSTPAEVVSNLKEIYVSIFKLQSHWAGPSCTIECTRYLICTCKALFQ